MTTNNNPPQPDVAGAPELKPCPFCGGKARIDLTTWGFTVVRCLNAECRASSYHRKDRGVAITSWNSRVATPPDVTERARRAAQKIWDTLDRTWTVDELAEIIEAKFK